MSDKLKYSLKNGPADKKRAEAPQPVFKTEDMLKQEARDRIIEEDRLEAEKPPKSDFQKKADNFFFHYKWHTIIAVIGAFLVAFFIRDTIFREKPDATVIIATSRFITQTETDALQEALISRMDDHNGDGKIQVSFDTIYLPIGGLAEGPVAAADGTGPDGAGAEGVNADAEAANAEAANMLGMSSMEDAEMIQASSMKLMAVVAAWTDPLFLLDDDMYEYLTRMSGPSEPDEGDGRDLEAEAGTPSEYALFEPLNTISGVIGAFGDRLAIKDTTLADEPGLEFLGGLTFSIRPAQGSNEKNAAYQAYCMRLLESLAAG